jgi:hypothetical protein
MEIPINSPISREELVRMAIKLRNDLFDYEDQLGSCRDFNELRKICRRVGGCNFRAGRISPLCWSPQEAGSDVSFSRPKRVFPNLAASGVGLQLINGWAGGAGEVTEIATFRISVKRLIRRNRTFTRVSLSPKYGQRNSLSGVPKT